MEGTGYLARASDPTDARACFLALTDAGSAELARLHRAQARTVSNLLRDWDDAKARELSTMLRELDSALAGSVLDLRHGTPTVLHDPVEPAEKDTDKNIDPDIEKAYS